MESITSDVAISSECQFNIDIAAENPNGQFFILNDDEYMEHCIYCIKTYTPHYLFPTSDKYPNLHFLLVCNNNDKLNKLVKAHMGNLNIQVTAVLPTGDASLIEVITGYGHFMIDNRLTSDSRGRVFMGNKVKKSKQCSKELEKQVIAAHTVFKKNWKEFFNVIKELNT